MPRRYTLTSMNVWSAVCAAVGACGGTDVLTPAQVTPTVTFAVDSAAQEWDVPSDSLTVTAARQRVVVGGRIALPTPCHDLSGSVAAAAGTLVIRVAARTRTGGCTLNLVGRRYRADVNVSRSGAYTVRVEYELASSDGRVYERRVLPAQHVIVP